MKHIKLKSLINKAIKEELNKNYKSLKETNDSNNEFNCETILDSITSENHDLRFGSWGDSLKYYNGFYIFHKNLGDTTFVSELLDNVIANDHFTEDSKIKINNPNELQNANQFARKFNDLLYKREAMISIYPNDHNDNGLPITIELDLIEFPTERHFTRNDLLKYLDK